MLDLARDLALRIALQWGFATMHSRLVPAAFDQHTRCTGLILAKRYGTLSLSPSLPAG